MKVVQRDIQLIKHSVTGDSKEEGIANLKIGVSISHNREFVLLGFSVIYELYADSINGSLEFEVRDFYAIDLQDERANAESLYKLVEQTANDSHRILMGESSKLRRAFPSKQPLKKIELIAALNLEIDEFYSLS